MATKQKRKNLTTKTQKTFDTIIKYAKKEFSKNGYSSTSIHNIAKRARLSVGCIYKYFKNKDDLYKYIIANEQLKIRQYLDEAIGQCKDRREKEKSGLRGWLFYVRDNPGVYKLIWETLFINKKAFDEYYNSFANSYKKALEKDANELSNSDYENIAYILIGISNFLGVKIITSEIKISDEEIEKMVESADKLLSEGLFKC